MAVFNGPSYRTADVGTCIGMRICDLDTLSQETFAEHPGDSYRKPWTLSILNAVN